MNRNRRKETQMVINDLERIKFRIEGEQYENLQDDLDSIRSDIETIHDDEQDYMDNIPENLQSSDRYYAAEAAVEHLDDALSYFDDAVEAVEQGEYEDASDCISDVIDELDEASA